MSYCLGTDELSLSEMRQFRLTAQNAAIDEALKLSLAATRGELVIRGLLPHTDFFSAVGNGYTNERFITGAIAINAWTSVYDTAVVPQLGNRKVMVIYKIINETPVPSVRAVRFRLGATGVSTLAWFQVEGVINVKLVPEAWLTEPVVYTPNQWMDIQCYANPAIGAGGEMLGFEGYVVEPLGESVS